MIGDRRTATTVQAHGSSAVELWSGPVTPEKLQAQREALDRAERCLADIRRLADLRIDGPGVSVH